MKKHIDMLIESDLTYFTLVNLIEKVEQDKHIEIIANASDIALIKNNFDTYISLMNKTVKYTPFYKSDKWVLISDNFIYISKGA